MAVTAASLRLARPEFLSASDDVINPMIAAAYLAHDAEVWGSLLDLGVELYVCDQLARSPYARDLRLQKDEERTVYQHELARLRRQVGGAWRVLP